MSANMYNFLRDFHTFLYKTGGHVYRHFVVKPRAYCRLVTGIVGDENEKTHLQLCKRYLEVSNTPSFSRDSKTKGLPHSFYCYLFFNRLFLLLVSISRSGTLPKYFMIANICNFLCVFHTFLYKIGGHVYRHFVVKPRAYCRLVTGIVGDVISPSLFNSL